MNPTRILLAASIAAFVSAAGAQQPKADALPAAAAKKEAPVEYRPPTRGAPKVRVGGSTRSAARALSLAVIAPDHTGLAASDQPELYWYVSQPVRAALEFTITASDGIDPLVERPLPPVAEGGIQRISLADLGVRLKLGEEYQWSISFVAEAGSRSKDTVASGRIRVAERPRELADRVARAGAGAYAAYAQAGYWYDAVAALRHELSRKPGDAALQAAQQSLLEQVGLAEVARHERARSPN